MTHEPGGNLGASAARIAFRFDLFAVLWAAAALFHLAGDQRPAWIGVSTGLAVVEAGIALAAGAILVGWRRRTALLVLCLLIPVSAWLEAPVVGNHWVLAALVSLTYVVAFARARGKGVAEGGTWERFAPAARLTVVIAYGFAAFAKLNSDFFDPAVSCAVFYGDQLAHSWGLTGINVAGAPAVGAAMAVGAAVVELSVAALLAFPQTRRWGLLVAVPFHWLLALDFSQHFWDFSSVLFAAFLLFADDTAVDGVRARLAALRAAVRPALARVAAGFGVVVWAAVVGTIVARSPAVHGVAILGGHVVWVFAGTTVAAVTLLAVLRTRASEPVSLRAVGVALLLPALAFVNGLTPYLEIKTGFGWNMYSNLHTVAGQSNHLLIPSTLDLTRLQNDRVQILAASDARMEPMINSGFEIVYSEFREYAHAFPEESVSYRRGGQTYDAARLRDDPAGQGGVNAISHRLQSFRVVDTSGSDRCQSVFSPAR